MASDETTGRRVAREWLAECNAHHATPFVAVVSRERVDLAARIDAALATVTAERDAARAEIIRLRTTEHPPALGLRAITPCRCGVVGCLGNHYP